MSKNLQRRMQCAIGLAAIALFLVPELALAAKAEKATLQSVTQQFQQASAVVITSAGDFFSKMNEVDRDGALITLAYEGKAIDIEEIRSRKIISDEELKVRTDTLKALSQYTTDLANLASGASFKTFGQNLQSLNKNLTQIGTDAGKLPGVSKASFLQNKEFPGLISLAVSAVGAIAALIEGKKAQNEIRQKISDNDKDLTNLINHVGTEMGLAFQRQKEAASLRVSRLTRAYNDSLDGKNLALSVLLPREVEASNEQYVALTKPDADPSKAVTAMQKAHEAMVQYVKSGNKGTDLDSLLAAVASFSSAAQSSQAALPIVCAWGAACATAK